MWQRWRCTVDYDKLTFKIYKIECDNALTISKECKLLNYHEMREKYDIDKEVDDTDNHGCTGK